MKFLINFRRESPYEEAVIEAEDKHKAKEKFENLFYEIFQEPVYISNVWKISEDG